MLQVSSFSSIFWPLYSLLLLFLPAFAAARVGGGGKQPLVILAVPYSSCRYPPPPCPPPPDSHFSLLLFQVSSWAHICKRLRSPGINSEESITPAYVAWARICKRFRSPEINSEESFPPAYVAWRDGKSNRVVIPAHQAGNRYLGFLKGLKIRALFYFAPPTPPPPVVKINRPPNMQSLLCVCVCLSSVVQR